MLLFLVACGWIGEFALDERLDQDLDGYVLGVDCHDDNAGISTFDDAPVTASLTCGETVTLTIGNGDCASEDFPEPVSGFDRVVPTVLPCADPLDPDRYLATQFNMNVVEVTVDAPTEVQVALASECLRLEPQPDEVEGLLFPALLLAANRGPVCGVDRCVVGNPLIDDITFADQFAGNIGFVSGQVGFQAEPGERWFVVASAGHGTVELEVTCPGRDEG